LTGKPSQEWAADFAGFNWTTRTGIVPEHAPKLLDTGTISLVIFEDFNAPKVFDAIRDAIEECDRLEAGRQGALLG
jgi:hypothetical protein